jgi:hypothetical protein
MCSSACSTTGCDRGDIQINVLDVELPEDQVAPGHRVRRYRAPNGNPLAGDRPMPWLVGESDPRGRTAPEELYQALKPFKDKVAEDIKGSDNDGQ